MDEISADTLDEIREIFKLMDSKGDSKIRVKQVGPCLRILGLTPTEAEIKSYTKCWKGKKGVRVSVEEFVPIFQNISAQKADAPVHSTDDFIGTFAELDRNGDGMVSAAQLKLMLSHMGEKLTEKDVDELLVGYENSDGLIDVARFVKDVCDTGVENKENA
ncbi:hypothetical protein AB6A40_007879 [Gnathostoma spinigerum]|uniref:EF-hand domain-containing protein n=1 Tax=Gnathostoma spinigerum TaxID=75299 RepID=A0ABD6EMI1_9BILA